MKVITWNLRYSSEKSTYNRLELLKNLEWNLLALQEVSRNAWKVLVESDIFDDGYFPLATFGLRPPDYRVHGAAIIARNGYKLSKPRLVPQIPKAERAIAAQVEINGRGKFTIVSWHAPNAASEGVGVKMRGYQGISDFLVSLDGPIVLCFDGNHWNTRTELDPPEPYPEDDAFYLEELFFSQKANHHLNDTYLEYLRKHSEKYQEVIRERPNGPLAVSYVRKGSATKPIEDRFDYIFASDGFIVKDCKYLYEEAIAAGSDHALVIADLDLK